MSVTKTRIEIPLSRCKFKTEKRMETASRGSGRTTSEREGIKMVEPKVNVYTFAQIKKMVKENPEKFGEAKEWEMRNDMVKSFGIEMSGHGGNIIMPFMTLHRNKQTFLTGYVSTHNVGYIIRTLAELFGFSGDDTVCIIKWFVDKPIRILFRERPGYNTSACTFFGNFLDDKFIYLEELMSVSNEFFKPEFFGRKAGVDGNAKGGGNGGADKGEGASDS